ncbi:MAG: helix-turn-helix domain-containing protein [Myxococcales bacterium]|jgi:AcrR family transcriptional regulator
MDDPRALRKQRKQAQVREEILAAARAVVLEGGLSGFSLSAVARALSLSKAALYHYFDSKEALAFELMYRSLRAHADAVAPGIASTTTGADALEALIRGAAAHYGPRKDDLRLTYLAPQVDRDGAMEFDRARLERIRPINDQLFGPVAERIAADQERGHIPADVDGRRLAFVAHASVLGVLTVEGLVEVAEDPLLYSNAQMVDDIVSAFRARLLAPA